MGVTIISTDVAPRVAATGHYEFRVRWQREGHREQTKIFQTRAGAERWCLRIEGRIQELTGLDPDDYACCSSRECGCGGELNRDVWEDMRLRLDPVVSGPTIEARPVGAWGCA